MYLRERQLLAYLQSCGRNHRLCSQEQEFKMSGKETSYGTIFKTTFLFGFVQVFRIIVGVVKNKIVAVLLGTEGVGLLGVYSSAISLLQQGAGLGISQSGVRDIADANGKNDKSQFSRAINVINKVILLSGLLGCVVTLILSKFLSEWTLGNNAHTIGYCVLGVAVAFNIINEGKQAILKGMRQMKALANASMIGVSVGLITAVPIYYFFGKEGIIPELLIASISAYLVSGYYVRKIQYDKEAVGVKEAVQASRATFSAGVTLMLSSFLAQLANLIIISYIRSHGGLEDVGIFNAGSVIMTSYFGVMITALSTDYFPRISAVWNDNLAMQEELNRQSIVSLLLCCPLFVIFITLMPLFIKILYTNEFLPAVDFIKFGVIGTIITIVSNQVDMILVAKFKVRIMFVVAVFYRLLQVFVNILLYQYCGLMGTGISLAIMGCIHLIVMVSIVYKLYGIKFSKTFLKLSSVVFCFVVVSILLLSFGSDTSRYVVGSIIIVLSTLFSLYVCNTKLKIDLLKLIKIK